MLQPNWVRWGLIGCLLCGNLPTLRLLADSQQEAADILQTAGFTGGFIVHVGAADGQLTAALKQSSGRKGKALFLPLRLALTGRDHGPDMAALLPLIGRERAIARLGVGETGR